MTSKDIILPTPGAGASRGRLVLFHGLTGTPDEMKDVAEYFNHKGFTVVLPCLSGHGASVDELRRVRTAEWSKDAERARDIALETGEGPLYTIGQSFGALLSLHIAEDKRFPVAAAALLSPPVRFSSLLRERVLYALSFLPDAILDLLGVVEKSKRPDGIFVRPRESYSVHSIGAGARLLQLRRSVLRRLSQIECPLLVLQDPHDHHLSNDIPQLLRRSLTHTQFRHVWVPGGQHELAMGLESRFVLEELDAFITNAS